MSEINEQELREAIIQIQLTPIKDWNIKCYTPQEVADLVADEIISLIKQHCKECTEWDWIQKHQYKSENLEEAKE